MLEVNFNSKKYNILRCHGFLLVKIDDFNIFDLARLVLRSGWS